MRAAWLVAIAAAVIAASAAYAEPGEYYPGLTISDNPSAAEQRAFIEALYKGWDVNVKLGGRDDVLCAALDMEMRAGNVTYLEPEAFGKTEKPQPVKDIEKQCPYLKLGLEWTYDIDDLQSKSEKEITEIYGEPIRATENFRLYRARLPDSQTPITVFFADRACRDGICSLGTRQSHIDEQRCVREDHAIFPNRYDNGDKGGPALLWTLVRIKGEIYFLEAGDVSFPPDPNQSNSTIRGGPGFELWRIERDVQPGRHIDKKSRCFFNSPKAPR